MNRNLRRVIDAAGGVATLATVRCAVARHVLDHAVRTRQLVRLFPRVYADPARLSDPWTRVRAALGYADGAKWHSSRVDRERDARRDAALAAMGIMVVRFTHDQLVNHPEMVRTQIRAIVAARLHGATA